MREVKLFVIVVVVVVIFMSMFFGMKMLFKGPPVGVAPGLYVEYEDDPNWDCHTMGNKVCGL